MARPTKVRILDTAADLLDKSGRDRFTLFALSLDSGVSNGSIYHHFGSKEGVVVAVVRRTLVQYQRDVLKTLSGHRGDAEAGIHAVVAHHLAWSEAHRREARLLLNEQDLVTGGPHTIQEATKTFLAQIQLWLDAHADADRMPRADAATALAVVVAPAQDMVVRWVRGSTETAPTAHADRLGAAAWAAVCRIGPAPLPA